MKKVILILAVMMFSASVASAQVEAVEQNLTDSEKFNVVVQNNNRQYLK